VKENVPVLDFWICSIPLLYGHVAGWTLCGHTMQVLGEYNPEPIRREVPEDSLVK
jgi:hypothetical protein